MSTKVFQRLDSPRAAIIGFSDEENASIEPLIKSPLFAENIHKLERPWDEIDIAIVSSVTIAGVHSDVPALLRLEVLGGDGRLIERRPFSDGGREDVIRWSTPSVEVHAVAQSSAELNRAIEGLGPLQPQGSHHYVQLDGFDWTTVFLRTPRGQVLAGEYSRSESKPAPAWVLPSYVTDLPTWVRLFLIRVHDTHPERVPEAPPSWVQSWETADEMRLIEERNGIESEYTALLREAEKRVQAKTEELDEVRSAAEIGWKRLLTSDGEPLKTVVQEAFETLSFDVVDVDEQMESGQGKREDLWVRRGDEVVLVEVKGYTKGASTNNLIRAEKYEVAYVQREGARPRSQWHVVNANRIIDPELRPRLFEGHQDVIDSVDQLIVDTRDLFRLIRDVELGRLSLEQAVDLLWDQDHGIWEYPSENGE